ncbi:membrane hypothetical protein [Clostridium neonatale]|uniref:acyltransferase family protein n=1 Tax=Clostridium neonatale TaxID=137838 RepID=UPI00291B6368|nr:acyltransferase family protein [Clostridium neonatale]CAI3704674.1 membrane hypothetical protein [Clostridium neonatale]
MERNKQFDILIFLGISFVVIGHLGGFDLLLSWFPIYSFHIPLFLFVSGYFYKNEKENDIASYIKYKFNKFILAYFIWNFFYMILRYILIKLNITAAGVGFDLYNFFIVPFQQGTQFGYNLPAWYILTLFLIEVAYILLRKLLIYIKIKNEYVIMIITFIIGILGVKLSQMGYRTGNSLIIVKMLFGIPFYHLGFLYKSKLERKDNIRNLTYFSIIFILQYIIIGLTNGNVKISMWNGKFCDDSLPIFAPYIIALPGIFFWLRISKNLVPILGNNKVIMCISKNSFSIMMHHQFAALIINIVFFIINHFYTLPNFDLEAFRTNGWYTYKLWNKNFSIFYFLAGITIPICINYLVVKVKPKILFKIKSFMKNNTKLSLFVLFFIGNSWFSLMMKKTMAWPDEPLTLAVPAYLAGYDWSNIISSIKAYYGYGYSILLTPLFFIIKDSVYLYKAISVFNSVLVSFIPMIAYIILEKYLKIEGLKKRIFISIVVGLMPLYCTITKIAMNEAMLMLLVWVILLIWLECFNVKDTCIQKKYLLSLLLSLVSIYGYTVHGRFIAVIIAIIIFDVIYKLLFKQNVIVWKIYAPLSIVLLFIDKIIKNLILNNIYNISSESELRNTFSNTLQNGIEQLLSIKGILVAIKQLIGYIFINGAISFGIIFVAISIFVTLIKKNKIKNGTFIKDLENNEQVINAIAYFSIVILSFILAIGINICFHIKTDIITCQLYERYTVYLLGPILLFAFWGIDNHLVKKKSLIISAILFIVICITTIILEFILPGNVSKTSIDIPTLATFIFKPGYKMGKISIKEFIWAVLFAIIIMIIIYIYIYRKKHKVCLVIILCIYLIVNIRGITGIWLAMSKDSYNRTEVTYSFFRDMKELMPKYNKLILEKTPNYYSTSSILLTYKEYDMYFDSDVIDNPPINSFWISNKVPDVPEQNNLFIVVREKHDSNIFIYGEELANIVMDKGYYVRRYPEYEKDIYPKSMYLENIEGIFNDNIWLTGNTIIKMNKSCKVNEDNNLIIETQGYNNYYIDNSLWSELNLQITINDKYNLTEFVYENNRFAFNLHGINEINKIEIKSNTFKPNNGDGRNLGIDLKRMYLE